MYIYLEIMIMYKHCLYKNIDLISYCIYFITEINILAVIVQDAIIGVNDIS